ncbi:MAG: ABC transporter permease [Planctomycetaceae bacterium]
MYKLLLSSRYLRTRFIALASIISVMLGVATLIVVNSVMAGFRYQMRDRLHSLLSDVVIESNSTDGASDPDKLERFVMEEVGEYVEAMAPTVEIYGMMSFKLVDKYIPRPVTIIGIDPERQHAVSPIREFLMGRQPQRDGDGNITGPPVWPADAPLNWELSRAAQELRKERLMHRRLIDEVSQASGNQFYAESETAAPPDAEINPFGHADDTSENGAAGTVRTADVGSSAIGDVPAESRAPHELFGDDGALANADPDAPYPARLFVGVGLIGYPYKDETTGKTDLVMFVNPGEDVILSTIGTGMPSPTRFVGTVVDVFKSGMSEFDSSLVFCPIEELQKARGMIDPATGKGDITMLKIKLKDYENAGLVVQRLRMATDKFPPDQFQIYTWEQKRAPLLQAVEIESAILNVLLFLIIAVAGFGILAIFYMIVVEKTRDIGILKALGASSRGVMSIFLTYGLSLGVVGSGVGVVMGLLFVYYINEIETALSWVTGRKVFDETIYYFHDIPTQVNPWMVIWVALGAMTIAVLASVLPARRASRLHPVRALRYE